ncbi:MAG: hypothetical protein N2Z76_01525 [Treponemataceae bacterium]|nr:hypothetical protein [Treponemataceae bacterium]
MEDLDVLYRQYHEGKIERSILERSIFSLICAFPARFRLAHMSYEERLDILSELFPYIRRAIEQYKDVGSSFSAYLYTWIQWGVKGYQRSEKKSKTIEELYWKVTYETEPMVAEPVCIEDAGELPQREVTICNFQGKKLNKQYLLFLVLKCYRHISDDFARRIAQRLGMEEQTLFSLLEKIKKLRERHDAWVDTLIERKHCYALRILLLKRELAHLDISESKKKMLENRLTKLEQKLQALTRRCQSLRLSASNSEVAQVLGLPKGTVDSGCYLLKWQWKRFHE